MHYEQQIKGLLLSLICLLAYAGANVLFKVSAGLQVNPLALVSLGMVFTGFALIARGGKTTLAYEAIRSVHTWVYGIASIVETALVVYLMFFITAAEAAVATRISIIFSLLVAYVFQHRNTLGQGIWGVPAILAGVGIVVYQFESADMLVLLLILLGISIFRNIYFFSIELNKAGRKAEKAKKFTQDLSVVGYIISVASILSFTLLFSTSAISSYAGLALPVIPQFSDFMNPNLFMLAACYGLSISVLIRYTEFKSVQYVKPEVFQCVTAFSPLVTLAFEKALVLLGVLEGGTELSATLAIANVLVITGSLYVIIRKYMTIEEIDPQLIQKTRQKLEDAAAFYEGDLTTVAAQLGVPKRVVRDMLADSQGKKPVLRRHISAITEQYAATVAAADRVTKLLNRASFEDEVKALGPQAHYALIFVDLDNFKPVNDTYGHAAGDAVLRAVGQRMSQLAEGALIGRIGGDEFALALPHASKEQAQDLALLLQQHIAQPIVVAGVEQPIEVGASTGVAHYPEDAQLFDAVLKHADAAMYRQKNSR